MNAVPTQPKYLLLGGIVALTALTAVTFISTHHRVPSNSLRDTVLTDSSETVPSSLTAAAGTLDPSLNVTVNGTTVEPNTGTQHIQTPGGSASVTVTQQPSGQASPQTTVSQTANGSVSVSVTTQSTNGNSTGTNTSSHSQSNSFTNVSGSANSTVFGTHSQVDIHSN